MPKLLLVEDNEMNRDMLSRRLIRRGFDVVMAVNRTRVGGLGELRTVVDALKPGDPIVLQLERHGSLMYLAFTVE